MYLASCLSVFHESLVVACHGGRKDRLVRCLSLLLLHCPHMPTILESTPSFTIMGPIVWKRTNMLDRELLFVSTSAFGASVLFENSDLVDRFHGPPIGFLAGAQVQGRPPDLRKHCILQPDLAVV